MTRAEASLRLGVQEIGHAGSLDPFATGVLVCGVGRGTKVVSYLMDLRKEYSGTMRLGLETDSGDITGETLGERPVPPIDLERAREASREFIGTITQVPPMVSAIKHQGQRLYDLARKGIEVERKPRTVEVLSFEITAVDASEVHFNVVCGKGTYVRALARDFGERLGTVACLSGLQRDAVGPFRIDRSVRVDASYPEIVEAVRALAIPLPRALAHIPALHLRPEWVRRVRQGSQPPWRATDVQEMPDTRCVQLLGPEEELVAIASIDAVPGRRTAPGARPGS